MYIAIVNYNMGNIKSVENAFKNIGSKIVVTGDPKMLDGASAVVLPGVGAFRDAIKNLKELHLYNKISEVIAKGIPFLGICIGLQVLFEYGMEGGKNSGLGIFKGTVEKIPPGVKIPHMGWNRIDILNKKSRIFESIDDKESFYFVHSYHVVPQDKEIISSTTEYGVDIVSSIECKNIFGLQFHPEKSSNKGLKIIKNFSKLCL